MYRGHTIGVVVPAYNEEAFVGDVITGIPGFVDRIYAIDDGSTDRTWQTITRCAHRENTSIGSCEADGATSDRRVVPIKHPMNRGVGGAIKTGYRRAYEDGMEIVAVVAGDGQMDPDELHRLLDPIIDGRADYAKGNRLANRHCRRGMNAWRFAGNVILTALTRVASGYWHISDPQNGYTAVSREALSPIDIGGLYDGFGFCNDLLAKLESHGFDVVDVSMMANYGAEESHIQYRTFIPRLSFLLVRIFVWRLYQAWRRGETAQNAGTRTSQTVQPGQND